MTANVVPIQNDLKAYPEIRTNEISPRSSNIGENLVFFKNITNKSKKPILNSHFEEYSKYIQLFFPDDINEKSKNFFIMYFPKKIKPSHKLSYYLGNNNELSVILQSANVTRTFVFQVNSKIRFTVKKRHYEKSLLQGEFTPLQISNPTDYIEKLINFFE